MNVAAYVCMFLLDGGMEKWGERILHIENSHMVAFYNS